MIWELYGGTEGQGSTTIRGDDWLTHKGSVGKPGAHCEMKIVGENGEDLPAGEIGEVFMRPLSGPGTTYRYIGAEAKAIEGGWESIGDIGYLDAEGYLYLSDRLTDMILSGGANIYPAEVEAAIDAYPGVRSSAVIGLPHEDLGNAVHAIVDAPDGVAGLRKRCWHIWPSAWCATRFPEPWSSSPNRCGTMRARCGARRCGRNVSSRERNMRNLILALVGAVIFLGIVLVVRAALHQPLDSDGGQAVESVQVEIDESLAAQHLSEAIRFRTVSHQRPEDFEPVEFEGFIDWVARTYPEVQEALTLTRHGEYTLLYRWQGSDPALAPVLITGHYDVVPVIPGTDKLWNQPPYAGVVQDGIVWGRGALDDKSAVIAQLEAVTHLLSAGFTPKRTLYFSFGHDEEVGGPRGAGAVTEYLREQGSSSPGHWTKDRSCSMACYPVWSH